MFASSSSPMVLGLPINLPKLQLSVLISYLFYIQQCVYARRSNQSILKEISPGYSLEGLMLKLNSSTLDTSCEELTHWKRPWCWEGLGTGGEGDDRGWDGRMHQWLDGRESEWTPGVGDTQGGLACCDSWGGKELDMTEWLNWTELNWIFHFVYVPQLPYPFVCQWTSKMMPS